MIIPSEPRFAVWQRLAERWDHVGPPLRPCPEDLSFTASALAATSALQPNRSLTSILLGVTPELAALLADTRMIEVDHSIDMIMWAEDRSHTAQHLPVVADWNAMPIAADAADFVAGDGCYSTADFPDGYLKLSREIARVLKPGGMFAIRLFVSPEALETPESVIDDLKRGRVGSCDVLRWRLNMALQPSTTAGARLGDTFAYWHSTDLEKFVIGELGWPPKAMKVLEAYRGMDTRYTFPTLAQARGVLAEHFREIECHVPNYEIGDRCPTLVLARR